MSRGRSCPGTARPLETCRWVGGWVGQWAALRAPPVASGACAAQGRSARRAGGWIGIARGVAWHGVRACKGLWADALLPQTDQPLHAARWVLQVRGPHTLSRYYNSEAAAADAHGWFDTGDVATIDPQGFMQVGG